MFALIISFLSVDNFCSAQEPLWNIKKSPFNFCKSLTPWILQLHTHTDAHRLCPSWKKFSLTKFQFVFRISTDGQRNLLFLFSLLSTLEPVTSKMTKKPNLLLVQENKNHRVLKNNDCRSYVIRWLLLNCKIVWNCDIIYFCTTRCKIRHIIDRGICYRYCFLPLISNSRIQ